MSETPPTNRLLQLLRHKPEAQNKSDTLCATKSDTPDSSKSDTPHATKNDTMDEEIRLSKGQHRVLRYLSQNRDPEHPGQTVIIGYNTISTFCFLSRSGSRKIVEELQKKGLVSRLDIRRGTEQGSVYTLHNDIGYATKSGILPEPESDTLYATKSGTRSSSIDPKKQLLQDLDKLSLEKAFADLNPNSLLPYLDQFDGLTDVQNFLDMANACIEASKTNGNKQIKNPHGFLFAQLRAGYVNPPPGFKSRRVLVQEALNAQLQAELDALRQLQEQETELRFELFKANLSEPQQAELEQEATKRVKPGSAVSPERQLDVYREEILRQWFEQSAAPASQPSDA